MALIKPLVRKVGRGFPAGLDSAIDTLQVGALDATSLSLNNGSLTGLAAAVNPTDAVTLAQAEGLVQGLKGKGNARALSDVDVALIGLQTIDGVSLTNNQIVLLTAQTAPLRNGAWTVKTGAWARPANFDVGSAAANAYWFVEAGATYADQGWYVTSDTGADVVDTDTLTVSQFNGASGITAGDGVGKVGNILSAIADPNGGLAVAAAGIKALAADATLNVAAAGLSVAGLPSSFTINGVATSGANVTAANLNTLTSGGDASGLHTHAGIGSANSTSHSHITDSPVTISNPLYIAATGNVVNADADAAGKDLVVGVALSTVGGGSAVDVVTGGLAVGVLAGATPGTEYWLQVGGGIGTAMPSIDDARLIRIGVADSATDLHVAIMDFGDN